MLQDLLRRCSERDVLLVVTYIPPVFEQDHEENARLRQAYASSRFTSGLRWGRFHDLLRDRSRQRNVGFIDVLEAFDRLEFEARKALYSPVHKHFTETGNAFLADLWSRELPVLMADVTPSSGPPAE